MSEVPKEFVRLTCPKCGYYSFGSIPGYAQRSMDQHVQYAHPELRHRPTPPRAENLAHAWHEGAKAMWNAWNQAPAGAITYPQNPYR